MFGCCSFGIISSFESSSLSIDQPLIKSSSQNFFSHPGTNFSVVYICLPEKNEIELLYAFTLEGFVVMAKKITQLHNIKQANNTK